MTPGGQPPGVFQNSNTKCVGPMATHLAGQVSLHVVELIRLERRTFAAKLRMARAVLNWSQSELALRVGLTQRAIHKLEQGDTEPRRTTVRAIEEVWREQGIEFEQWTGGGLKLSVHSAVIDRAAMATPRHKRQLRLHPNISATGHRAHRA
jgi:DNA-binding XRE family transcriptional regulator